MKEATELRRKEKAANAETVKDAQAAQTAVAAATAVLKDYYAKAATATALLQRAPSPREWALKNGTLSQIQISRVKLTRVTKRECRRLARGRRGSRMRHSMVFWVCWKLSHPILPIWRQTPRQQRRLQRRPTSVSWSTARGAKRPRLGRSS